MLINLLHASSTCAEFNEDVMNGDKNPSSDIHHKAAAITTGANGSRSISTEDVLDVDGDSNGKGIFVKKNTSS